MTEKLKILLYSVKMYIETEIGHGASGVCYKVKEFLMVKYFYLKINSHSLKVNI